MFTVIRTRVQRRTDRRNARALYFHADRKLGHLHAQLAGTTEARDRSKILRTMADEQMKAVCVYHTAFGRDPIQSEGGRDISESLTSSSKLYRVLGDVEHVVACNGRVGRNWRFHEWGEDVDAILDKMAATPDLLARIDLLDDLYDAVVPVVGGQAAEVVATIALDDKVIEALMLGAGS